MSDIVFCLLVAAARYTLTNPDSCGTDTDSLAGFLYHPSMSDNSDIAWMYSEG